MQSHIFDLQSKAHLCICNNLYFMFGTGFDIFESHCGGGLKRLEKTAAGAQNKIMPLELPLVMIFVAG